MAGGPAPPPAPGTEVTDRIEAAKLAPNSNVIITDLELVNTARDAGFRDDQPPKDAVALKRGPLHRSELAWAVAIALAESHADTTAVGNPGDGHVYIGLWQIQRTALDKSLFDANTNGRAAFGLFDSRGHKFEGTWSVFPDQARGFLQRAEVATKATHRGPIIDVPFGDIAQSVGFLVSFLTSGQTWIRLGEAVGGFIILILSIYLLVKLSEGDSVGTAVGKTVAAPFKAGAKVAGTGAKVAAVA